MNDSTSPRVPNYVARRVMVALLLALFVFFVALPAFQLLVRMVCILIVALHDVLVHLGVIPA